MQIIILTSCITAINIVWDTRVSIIYLFNPNKKENDHNVRTSVSSGYSYVTVDASSAVVGGSVLSGVVAAVVQAVAQAVVGVTSANFVAFTSSTTIIGSGEDQPNTPQIKTFVLKVWGGGGKRHAHTSKADDSRLQRARFALLFGLEGHSG